MLSYFQVEAPIHRPSFFLFFSLKIKDKTKISLTIKILHLGQGSFTRKVRTIFTLKIIVSIFVKLFLILVLHLRQFFILRIFVKKATGTVPRSFKLEHLAQCRGRSSLNTWHSAEVVQAWTPDTVPRCSSDVTVCPGPKTRANSFDK